MPQGVQISMISGVRSWDKRRPHMLDGSGNIVESQRSRLNKIRQPYYIAGDDTDAQATLDAIVLNDQASFYSLSISKAQLTDLINQYNAGTIPTGWNVNTYNQAKKIISDINIELNKMGNRQTNIANDPDIEAQAALDPQFADFVGIGEIPNKTQKNPGLQRFAQAYAQTGTIGIIPVIVIVVAIIVAGAVTYELIQLLDDWLLGSGETVEASETMKKAADALTPDEQKQYWADIQDLAHKNYTAGLNDQDSSFLGDATKLATTVLVGFLALKAFDLIKAKNA